MRGLLLLVKLFLARYPGLRRKIVNIIYRIPALDMRLRTALDGRNSEAWQRVALNDLAEEVQTVYERLRIRIKR